MVSTAQLCGSELVTNAVIHARSESRLLLRLDEDRLLVLVQDSGRHGVVRLPDGQDPLDVSGRGLSLVQALSSAWGAEHSADGTTVWFELDVPGRAAGRGER